MSRILASAPLLILLLFGSACNFPNSETPAAQLSSKINTNHKAMLEAARHELQHYEKELGQTEKQISEEELRQTDEQIGDGQGNFDSAVSHLLAKREQLEKKVLQSKVNLRELEILFNEEKDAKDY